MSVFQLVDNDNILEKVQEFRNGNDYLNLTKNVLIKLFLPDRHLAELDNRPSQDEGHLAPAHDHLQGGGGQAQVADRGGPYGEPPGGAGRQPDQRDPQPQAGRPHTASAELRLVRVLR